MSLSNDLSSPHSTGSPASVDSMPDTPVSPTAPTNALIGPEAAAAGIASNIAAANASASAANKRKPSRRANTAERRATHNAVERQRRETLNSRFLDLAALLPNLSQIRRPSKSAIVNSSIAHVHSARRHRAMAARELRLVKLEADALRRELNEWRDRAGLPRVEEPVRSDAFGLVMSGEVEIMPLLPGMDEEDDGADDDDFPIVPVPSSSVDDEAYLAKAYAQAQMRRQAPMIATNVPSVAFENPALPPALYDAHPPHISAQFQQQQQMQQFFLDDKHGWSSQLLAAQQQMQLQQAQQQQQQQQVQAQQAFSPALSGYGTPPSAGFGTPPGFANLAGAGGMFARPHLYGSPVDDGDASSVSSGRTRSSSMNGYEDAHLFSKRMSAGPAFAGAPGGFPLMM